ncbi:MAG: zinc ABC transporter substrate-binding protein [Aquamicrobium sp.]|uniref:zinc ABC transporter substrate-binding protein n=1 Tax=Aquamicrobium sp. TaxID=1872579 RepID=UPI00349E578F|nr:zinc ABC transporter substrate-binding protein [Aquamicrobium sp.]
MSRLFRSFALALPAVLSVPFAAIPAHALDGVVASVKPVHSLVAAVMEGVAEPALLVRGSGSEHVHSLRPSDAAALENAKIVFRVGEGMETFLNGPLKTLAAGARVVSLEDAPGLEMLAFREGGPFESHSHDDEDGDDHDGHDHEGHSHESDSGAHAHDHDHEGHSDENRAHPDRDLHFWLDPVNARAMVAEIARVLGEADPANAARYAGNAEAYLARLDALVAETAATVEPVKARPAIVFHDAYQYFEKRFGLNVAGSITVSPEVLPGAQRLTEIREKVKELGAVCVFSEPQFEPKLVSVVTEGTDARTGVLDPLGAEIADGADLYVMLIRNLGESFAACLAQAG